MHSFTDNAGRTWAVAINIALVKRVRGLVGVDLFGLVADDLKPLAELVGDPVRLADVLYCLVKDEADARGLTDEDFGRALAGDAIGLATDAFLEELADFFPSPQRRASLRKLIAAARQVEGRLLDLITARAEALDVEAMVRTASDLPTSSAGASASTPAPSPSANSS